MTKRELRRRVLYRVTKIVAAFNKVRRVLCGKGSAKDVLTMHADLELAQEHLRWLGRYGNV